MSTELIHVLFALAGAILGWFAKRHPELPPELAEVLKVLEPILAQRKQQQSHGLLQDIATALKAKPPAA